METVLILMSMFNSVAVMMKLTLDQLYSREVDADYCGLKDHVSVVLA